MSPTGPEQKRGKGNLQNTIAGALSGAVSRLVVSPLDVIKIRFQIQREPIASGSRSHYTGFVQAFRTVVKEEGIKGLWRGTVPALIFTVPYTAVQFVTYEWCQRVARRANYGAQNSSVYLISGACAGVAATLASYPFDLLRTTLAAQGEPKVYAGLREAAQSIAKSKGLTGFYKGLHVTLLEIIPLSAIQFASYEFYKTALQNTEGTSTEISRKSNLFLAGFLSGITSKVFTHPLDVVKKRYQVAGLGRSLRYGKRIDQKSVMSIMACLSQIARAEGVPGLWKGCIPNLAKAGPAAAVTFFTYELLIEHLLS